MLNFAMIGCRGHSNSYVFGGIRNRAQVQLAAISGGGDNVSLMLAAAQKYRFSPDVYDDWRKMPMKSGRIWSAWTVRMNSMWKWQLTR